ncbi:hypothetical protein K501DRAFT_29059 [Backusella circina FSU 941]|nr:hypothetical protein K501DRAFT_29059 [Backusella circina FSU 941]
MMRRLSRTSDHSSIYLESEEDEDLEDFMRFIGSKQDLKLFQNSDYQPSIIAESHSSLFANDSIYKSKRALSHFRNLQETHNTLSDTMLLNQQNPTSDYYSNMSQHSYGSSSSSNKGLNQPAIPSPLHTIESIASLSKNESPKDLIPTPPPPPPPLSPFFDYNKETAHSKRHQQHHQVSIDKKELVPMVLQNRQPAPSPPLALQQRYSTGQSLVDDDDSLVFKMSELGYEGSEQLEFNATATEYTKRLQQRGMRRINSSGSVPRLKKRSPSSDEEEEQKKSPGSSGTNSAISSKSDPVSMPPAGTLAHSLFYNS